MLPRRSKSGNHINNNRSNSNDHSYEFTVRRTFQTNSSLPYSSHKRVCNNGNYEHPLVCTAKHYSSQALCYDHVHRSNICYSEDLNKIAVQHSIL